MAKYVCTVCGYEYDPAVGDPDSGIAPGTAFEDIPDDWVCPLCGVGKDSFTKVEQGFAKKPFIFRQLSLFYLDISVAFFY